jgi:hypothetical protein
MRSIHRTLRVPSVFQRAPRNRAVPFRLRFITSRRKEVHINIKTDAGVAFVSAIKYIIRIKNSEGSMLVSAHASKVYAV